MKPCACAHAAELHDDGGRCAVTLPPFEEQELPAWACPCRKFTAAVRPAGPWQWNQATQSWQGVAS